MGAHINGQADARDIMDALRRIVRALRLFDRRAEKSAGLSGAQLFVLGNLRRVGPVSINELAARTRTDQSSVSVIVQKLVDRGLAHRARSIDDRRRVEIAICPRGRALLEKTPGSAQERILAALGDLPNAHRRQLAARLSQLVRKTGIDSEKPEMFFEDSKRFLRTTNHHE